MFEEITPMIIAGYGFTFFNYICYCTSRFAKKKSTMLVLDITSKILMIIGTFCLGSFSGSATMFLMIIGILASYYKETRTEKFDFFVDWGIFILLCLTYVPIFVFFYQGISTILVVLTSIIALIGIWWLRPQGIRFLGSINSVLFFIYQMTIKNWVGILEIIVFVSNVTAFIKYQKKEKEDENFSDK